MPENPSNDDKFADLFSRLPTPARPDGGVSGRHRTSEDAAPTADARPAPGSRRAARAAADSATTASIETSAVDASAVAPERPIASVGHPHAEPVAARGSLAASPAAPSVAPTVLPSVAPAAQPIDALFTDHHDEDERRRATRHKSDRRKSRIAGWVIFGLILAILGGIVAGGFVVWNTYEDKIRAFMGWQEPADYPADAAEGEATVTIVSGDTGSSISTSLFDAGVTKTSAAFYNYLVSTGQNPTFQPGVYTLKQKMSSAAALTALQDPANRRENTAQLPEGLTMDRTLQRLADGTDRKSVV